MLQKCIIIFINLTHDGQMIGCSILFCYAKTQKHGSGCGSVGREVASNTKGPRLKSSHRQTFIYMQHLVYCQPKDQNKEKEARYGTF